jgi:threonine dehydrogenase-like Zn-dependent dehydrogenase
MKALVYDGPGKIEYRDHPMPALQADTDIIMKISESTICGTDLHIIKGGVPARHRARTRGHRRRDRSRELGAERRRRLWAKQVTITTGIPSGLTIPQMLNSISTSALDGTQMITHRMPLKVVLTN